MNPDPNKPFSVSDYLWSDESVPPPVPYTEVPAASALIRQYTESRDRFPWNRYATTMSVTPDAGGYYTIDGDTPTGRIYRTARYCFPFGIRAAGPVPDPEVVYDHAIPRAVTAMSVRVTLGATLLTTPACWVGDFGTYTAHITGDPVPILSAGIARVRYNLDALRLPHDGLRLVAGPVTMRNGHIRAALEEVMLATGPIEMVAENTHASTRTGREYRWPDNHLALVYQQPAVTGESERPTVNHSTLQCRFAERMVVETKSDANGHHGRIVEDYNTVLACPQTGFLFVWG